MPRERSRDEVRRLLERGIFDVGTGSFKMAGHEITAEHEFWDGYVPPASREAPRKRRFSWLFHPKH